MDIFRVRKDRFGEWRESFPNGIEFIYMLSIRNETELWVNAMKEANAAIDVLGGLYCVYI